MIISVGYRVKSIRGTQFRIWANSYSKENVLDYENSLDNEDNSIKKYDTAFYCIKDCIIIKDDEIIPLS